MPHSLPFELKQETWLANFGVIAMRNYLAAISDLSYRQRLINHGQPGRPSICKWASRITLEKNGTHVEGLPDGKANASFVLVLRNQAFGTYDEHDSMKVLR
jgi:hypothetical protein